MASTSYERLLHGVNHDALSGRGDRRAASGTAASSHKRRGIALAARFSSATPCSRVRVLPSRGRSPPPSPPAQRELILTRWENESGAPFLCAELDLSPQVL